MKRSHARPSVPSHSLEDFAAKGAAAQKAVDAALASSRVIERLVVKLDELAESPWNPRTTYDPAKLDELARSVREVGVLQPLLVRPMPKGAGAGERFEIVFGHRRFRAANLAKLESVPVEVRELDDRSVLGVQLVENLQRAELQPLEEARAYRRMISELGISVDELAERVGLSRSSVYERLRLLELPEKVRAAVGAGAIPVSTAGLLLRISDPKARDQAAAAILGGAEDDAERRAKGEKPEPLSFRSARSLIRDEFLLELKGVDFDPADATLVPKAGACGGCPKRTGNMAGAAEALADSRPDVCTDSGCFRAKVEANWMQRAAEHLASGGKVLPDAKRASVFAYGDRVSSQSGFVDAADRPYRAGFEGRKTWKSILAKSGVGVVLARSPKGRIVELFPEELAEKLLKQLGPKPERQESSGDKALQRAQKKARDDAKRRAAVLAAFQGSKRDADLVASLRVLAAAVVFEAGGEPFAELARVQPAEEGARKLSPWDKRVKLRKGLEALAYGPNTAEAVRAGLQVALASALLEERHGDRTEARKRVESVLRVVGLDRSKVEAEAEKPKPAAKAGPRPLSRPQVRTKKRKPGAAAKSRRAS